jgi:tRNA-binding protein
MITWEDFERIDMRAGTIVSVENFPKAKKPAFRLKIDFGELGIKSSSAQITHLYTAAELLGKQVIAVVNFPPRQVANFFSECLVLGLYSENGVVILQAERAVPNGSRVG